MIMGRKGSYLITASTDQPATDTSALTPAKSVEAKHCRVNEGGPSTVTGTLQVENSTSYSLPAGIVTAMLMGFLYGFIFEKSRVYEPTSIRQQFLFTLWRMLKLFFAAVGTSSLTFVLFSLAKPKLFNHIRNEFHDCTHRGIITSTALGAFLLGSGMSIVGGCPGMVAVQVGSNIKYAWIAFIGSFSGALLYGLSEPITNKLMYSGPKLSHFYLDSKLNKPYWIFGSGMVVMTTGGVLLLELLKPWKEELPTGANAAGCGVFSCYAWPPWASGILFGLLQIPAILIIKDTIGSSTAYHAVTSLSTYAIPETARRSYFEKFHSATMGWKTWWQVVYIGFAMVGAFLSAYLSDSIRLAGQPTNDYGVRGPTPGAAFIGGMMMLYGSRLAAGCTSGHGISGMSMMNSSSLIAVPCMFAGGIITSFIYQAFDPDFSLSGI